MMQQICLGKLYLGVIEVIKWISIVNFHDQKVKAGFGLCGTQRKRLYI